ncbi:hypothetical protein E2320_004134 [Naja naja]|nr:hypothetical protein E2320_004134 [Naja naja]
MARKYFFLTHPDTAIVYKARLEENYEIAEGVCIPRSALYMHYLDFCEKNDTQPIIRQQFPQLTTRRLGTRGQSKYHYYGIAVKESSQYYDVMYSKKGAAWVNETGKKEVIKQTVAYSPRSKLGTLLPEFPNVKDLNLPASLPEEKVSTFIMMYRTHCQRILDTVIRANFDEVQSFLLHFWQGMPPHMLPVLGSSTVVNIVGVCDSILYKAISGVLMPTVLQALPDSLTQVIRKFAKQLDEWLKVALHDLPENLRNIKFELSRRFSQILRRQTSLNHLCQASRTVIHSADITFQMLEDWRNVDLNSITKQTLYTMEDSQEEHRKLIIQLYQEFDHLLEEQSPIESYIEWLDSMVDRCVVKVRSFHLIHLMFDDYVLYLLESLHCQERANELMRAMKGGSGIVEVREDIIVAEPVPSSPSPVAFSPAKSATSVDVPSVPSPITSQSPEYAGLATTTGAMQSYTWSLTYTVTTAAGSPAESSQPLPCMRSPHVPHSSVTHRIPVYHPREEHGKLKDKKKDIVLQPDLQERNLPVFTDGALFDEQHPKIASISSYTSLARVTIGCSPPALLVHKPTIAVELICIRQAYIPQNTMETKWTLKSSSLWKVGSPHLEKQIGRERNQEKMENNSFLSILLFLVSPAASKCHMSCKN